MLITSVKDFGALRKDGSVALTADWNAGAFDIKAQSFTIGTNSLTTVEWAYLDGQNQAVASGSSPTFNALTVTTCNSLTLKSTATGNIAIGDATTLDALATTPTNNIAIGVGAGSALTDGDDCILIGYRAGYSHTTSGSVIAIGYEAAYAGSIVGGLTAVGYQAMRYHTGGNGNTCFGYQSGMGHVHGAVFTYNTFVGELSGVDCHEGGSNSFFGKNSGYNIYDGSRNIFLGFAAGYRQTDLSDRLIIDNQQRADVATELSNAIIYGVMAAAPANQTLIVNAVLNCTENIQVDGTQVVGVQGAAVADATDAASVILRLNDLLARCRAHGLIDTT